MAASRVPPTKEEPAQADELSYKWFAEHGFYRAVNARLLELADIRPGQRIVELACGTGAVTRMILEKLRGARDSVVIAIDYSAAALKEAAQQLSSVRDSLLQLVQSRAEELSRVVRERVDAIVFCNGIHNIQDKDVLLAEVSRALKAGGVFAFNTTFYQGGQPQETEQFYRRWMMKAIRLLKSQHGVTPQPQPKVEARRHLSKEQYRQLLAQHGLRVEREEEQVTHWPVEGFVDISRFEDFVEGCLPGVPLDLGSRALQEGARLAWAEMGLQSVPRKWLEVVAVKG